MKDTTRVVYNELFCRYPALSGLKENILHVFNMLKETYLNGGTIFCAGNGGSAADAEHVVGELLKSFKKHRPIDEVTSNKLMDCGDDGKYLLSKLEGSIPALSLVSQTGVLTAFANDKSWDVAMAQQLYGLGKSGDSLIVLSTSGNSKNCIYAVLVAKAKGIKTIGFTGEKGGKLIKLCDECICVPEFETYKVQEYHLPIYHCICAMLEEELF